MASREQLQHLSCLFLNYKVQENDDKKSFTERFISLLTFSTVISTLAVLSKEIVSDNATISSQDSCIKSNQAETAHGVIETESSLSNATNLKISSTDSFRAAASAMTGILEECTAPLIQQTSPNVEQHEVRPRSSHNEAQTQLLKTIGSAVIHSVLQYAMGGQRTSFVDLHIVTSLARGLHVDGSNAPDRTTALAAQLIATRLNLPLITSNDSKNSGLVDHHPDEIDNSLIVSEDGRASNLPSVITLAVQFYPWEYISSVSVVELATQHQLWHGAERIAASTVSKTSDPFVSPGKVATVSSTVRTVLALIDGTLDCRMYRNADTFASTFFEVGGYLRFMDARYLHACDTIAKVIRKNALPIIERQVLRIDESVEKFNNFIQLRKQSSDDMDDGCIKQIKEIQDRDFGKEIRLFAIRQLEEQRSDVVSAQRLASIWGMEYTFDEAAAKAVAEMRRQKYLQWDDVFHSGIDDDSNIPDIASTPSQLHDAFKSIGFSIENDNNETHSSANPPIYGFDAEWGGEGNNIGVALLQISTLTQAILIDIPALSKSEEGLKALEQTAGRLFASSIANVVGFACRQDIARLRSSPTVPYNSASTSSHWLHKGTHAVRDLQAIIGKDQPKLKDLGLSRCCEFYLGKPLDKSEQCSLWEVRPLSREQRIYASLDAYVCAAIYKQLLFPSS